jgi:hypothetical protein
LIHSACHPTGVTRGLVPRVSLGDALSEIAETSPAMTLYVWLYLSGTSFSRSESVAAHRRTGAFFPPVCQGAPRPFVRPGD